MFAKTVEEEGGDAAVFGGSSQSASADHTITIFTSADGAAGSRVSVHKSVLLSALTFNTAVDQVGTSIAYNSKNNTNTNDETVAFNATFGHSQSNETLLNLADISVGVITQALENIAFLRAQNGGTASRLAFNAESLVTQKTKYACSPWPDGRCRYRRGNNQLGQVLRLVSGLREYSRSGKCQY